MKSSAVIISGGMGGIGRAIATRLASEGKLICVLYHTTPKAEVNTFVSSLYGSGHISIECDITKNEDIKSAVADASDKLGGLNIAIHAAVSPLVRERASVIDPIKFREQFEVTIFGALNFFQAVIPYLRGQKCPHLIGITTASLDNDGASGMSGYFCAKYALRGLLREFKFELPANIRVDEVSPGFIDTQLHKDLPEVVRTFIKERTPTQTPDDIADIVSELVRS